MAENRLFIGPDTELNRTIVSKMAEPVHTFWAVMGREQDGGPENLERVSIIVVEGVDRLSDALLSGEISHLSGVVFAAGKGGVRPVKMNTSEFVSDMFRENVVSFTDTMAVLTKKRKLNQGASVVALSSVSSVKGLKSKSAYSASKAALDAAVRGMAAELAPKGIRVNSIQKGWVESDMSLDFIENSRVIGEKDDFLDQPLGAIHPVEIAETVCFLLSDKVKSITGTAIRVDGGYTL